MSDGGLRDVLVVELDSVGEPLVMFFFDMAQMGEVVLW